MNTNKKEFFLYIFLFIFILFQVYVTNTIDMDYWARLLQGDAFWQLGHILKYDPFSYIPTHAWIDHEWGSSVIFSFINNHCGFSGILLFRAIISFLILFFVYKTIKISNDDINCNLVATLFLFAIPAMPTVFQSGLRCHFFTFLFFSIFLYILELVRVKNKQKLLFILPIIMLIWANVHGGCVSGLGLLGMYTVGECLNKKQYKNYIITLLACIGVLFINPYGFDYVKFIFIATTMSRPFVTEWISPFMHPVWSFFIQFKIFYVIAFLVLLSSFKKYKNDYTKYIVLFSCAYLSFRYVKNTPFFIIVSLVYMYQDVSIELVKKYSKILLFIVLITSFGMLANTQRYFLLSSQPYKVIYFIKANELKGNILAPFDMGSYIVYKLYPDNLIYMDGRYEEVYYERSKSLIDNFYNTTKNYDEILKLENKPDYIIVPSDAVLVDLMDKNKDYRHIYTDEYNVLYISNNKLKTSYKLPSNNNLYYIRNAFKTNFKFTDDIYINGEKVIFK